MVTNYFLEVLSTIWKRETSNDDDNGPKRLVSSYVFFTSLCLFYGN